MSLFKIAWRSIQQRGLASVLTTLSMALGVMLVVAVLSIHGVVGDSFRSNASLGYNMIVGAKGGKLQLTLNTVYYLSQPVENIPYEYYLEFLTAERRNLEKADPGKIDLNQDGQFGAYTQMAIPLCLGDYFGRFRVIGTTPEFFEKLAFGPNGDKKFEFAKGRNFHQEEYFEAVVGHVVAGEKGVKLGDVINPSHGVPDDHFHEEGFKVVGILKPSGTPNDRAVFVNMEGFYLMDNHAKPVEETADVHDPGDSHDHASDADGHGDHEHDHSAKNKDAASAVRPADTVDAASDDTDCQAAIEPSEADDPGAPASARPAAEDSHGNADGAKQSHQGTDPEHAGHEHADHDHHEDSHADHDHAGHDHAGHDHHDHGHRHHDQPLPINQREVTAILVLTSSPFLTPQLENMINEGRDAQAVLPVREIYSLFDAIVTPLQAILVVLTTMICVVSGISILVSIYNSMSERRHEIAVMRALGAGRGTVMTIILLESIILSLGGGAIGAFVGHLLNQLASPLIEARTGVAIGFFDFQMSELLLVPAIVSLAILCGFFPALSAYRTDVAKSLGS